MEEDSSLANIRNIQKNYSVADAKLLIVNCLAYMLLIMPMKVLKYTVNLCWNILWRQIVRCSNNDQKSEGITKELLKYTGKINVVGFKDMLSKKKEITTKNLGIYT